MPEFGGDRVLDRQRVDVARRQREDRGEDAADDLEEAPLRVRMDLVEVEVVRDAHACVLGPSRRP